MARARPSAPLRLSTTVSAESVAPPSFVPIDSNCPCNPGRTGSWTVTFNHVGAELVSAIRYFRVPMTGKAFLVAATAASVLLGACNSPGSSTGSPATERAAIEQALDRWPVDFAAGNVTAVCGLFAPDAVLSYPGTPDRNRNAACSGFKNILASPDKDFRYAAPMIEETLIRGDLAVVRLIWTLTVSDKRGRTLEVDREKGLDVFERQHDHTWKMRFSQAFPF